MVILMATEIIIQAFLGLIRWLYNMLMMILSLCVIVTAIVAIYSAMKRKKGKKHEYEQKSN